AGPTTRGAIAPTGPAAWPSSWSARSRVVLDARQRYDLALSCGRVSGITLTRPSPSVRERETGEALAPERSRLPRIPRPRRGRGRVRGRSALPSRHADAERLELGR